jgi:type II secretion system protein N
MNQDVFEPKNSATAPAVDIEEAPPLSKKAKALRTTGWVAFGILCMILFTLFKLPDDRIKTIIDGHISAALAQRGISYTATEGKLSLFFGLTYRMRDITLNFPPPAPPVRIEQVKVSPSILSFIMGKKAATIELKNAGGYLHAYFSMKGTKFSTSFKSEKLDLGKIGVLPIAAGIQGSAVLDGKASLDGDMYIPSTLDGDIGVQLARVQIEPQSIMGFNIPKIEISEAVIDANLGHGKIAIKTARIGKAGNTSDDLRGTVNGDVTLNKSWNTSTLNLKTQFSLSESILKSFMLLDALLGVGKQADGSYAFSLTGPATSPMPTPIK